MNKKTNGSLFWKVFAIGMALLCIACVIALCIGNKLMLDYDNSQREAPSQAAKIAEEIASGNFGIILDSEDAPNSVTFEREKVEEFLKEKISAGDVISKKGFSVDRYERPTYVISAGGEKIATVEFKKSGKKTGFGFDKFVQDKIIPSISAKYAIKVLVPDGCALKVNGIVVNEKYITGTADVAETAKDALYLSDSENKQGGKYYYIDNLISEPVIDIYKTDSGESLSVVYKKSLDAWTVEQHSFGISAPSTAKVYVNGVLVSDDARFLTEEVEIEALKESLKYVDSKLTEKHYHVSGVNDIANAEVKCVYFDGASAVGKYNEEEGGFRFANGDREADYESMGINRDFIMERAIGYAKAIMNDSSVGESILPYVYREAAAFKEFDSFWATFSAHEKYWIEKESVNVVELYNNELIMADVSFDYWVTFRGSDKCYPTSVTFWYAKKGGEWKIVDYAVADTQEDV